MTADATRTPFADARVERNRAMLRVRDAIDVRHAEPLDLAALAALVHVTPEHLIRTFRTVFGETPYRYLQRRRVERAMTLLDTTDLPVTEVCLAVGFTSLGSFSRTFARVVGVPPTEHRARPRRPPAAVPGCVVRSWSRPSEHARGA
ncbi:helix-turn-helix transcriptional regulator [Cellulomonas endophytica]|uniref:helix-turn-helix transcriptional regulator n=1 Tax=Cellulomonas endophytica TaxID=2494735 RepID=UPI0010133605|nr:helix-turn-helix transcriptional regulator [Cellulomonas endophytica]